MFRCTVRRRIGTTSTILANLALFAANTLSIHDVFGVLLVGGVVFRFISLAASIYGDRCVARAACALPELQEAHEQYKTIVDHPRAIFWEKKVAAQKLKSDRNRIFRSHHVDNVRLVLPHAVAVLMTWYSFCSPAQQLSDHLAVVSVTSPLSFRLMGTVVDPTLCFAATLTLISIRDHLQRRMGFSDGLDAWIRRGKGYVTGAWGVFTVITLSAQFVTSFAGFLPPHVAPTWLGISITSLCKSILVNHTAPMRALFRIQDYPPSHGKHGATCTAEVHEYRLAFTGVDVEERRHMWQTQKKALDYECNVRLHRLLNRTGLFDSVEEAEHEAERLKKKLNIARTRRKERELRERGDGESDGVAPPATLAFKEDDVGPSADEVAERHFDELQLRENDRRRKRRGHDGG